MTDEISNFADHTKFFQRSGMLEHQKIQVYRCSNRFGKNIFHNLKALSSQLQLRREIWKCLVLNIKQRFPVAFWNQFHTFFKLNMSKLPLSLSPSQFCCSSLFPGTVTSTAHHINLECGVSPQTWDCSIESLAHGVGHWQATGLLAGK